MASILGPVSGFWVTSHERRVNAPPDYHSLTAIDLSNRHRWCFAPEGLAVSSMGES